MTFYMTFYLHKDIYVNSFQMSNDDKPVIGVYANDDDLYYNLPMYIKYYVHEAYIYLYALEKEKGYVVKYDNGFFKYCNNINELVKELDYGFKHMKTELLKCAVCAKDEREDLDYEYYTRKLREMYNLRNPGIAYTEWIKEQ